MMPPRRRAAGHTALLVIGVAAMSGSLAHAQVTTHKASPTRIQFRVSGLGPVAKGDSIAGNVVVDPKGGEHVLTDSTTRAGDSYYRYFTKRPHHKLTMRVVHEPIGVDFPSTREVLSTNGKRVYGAIANCRGLWTTSTAIKSVSMPKPTPAIAGPQIGCPGDHSEGFLLDGAVALPHGRLAVLADPDADGIDKNFLYVGTPGGSEPFTQAAVQPPTNNSGGYFSSLTRDATTGRLVLWSAGQVTVGTPHGGWSDPVETPTLDDTYRQGAPNMVAANGTISILVSKAGLNNNANKPGTLLLQGSESTGVWQPPAAPSHTMSRDVGGVIGVEPGGKLTVAFVHCTRSGPRAIKGRIKTIHSGNSTWSKPQAISKPIETKILGVAIAKHHRPVVAFDHTIRAPSPYFSCVG